MEEAQRCKYGLRWWTTRTTTITTDSKRNDYPKHPEATGVTLDAFVTLRKVIEMIDRETRKTTATMTKKLQTGTNEDTSKDINQIGYASAKERTKTPIFHFVEKALIFVVHHGCLNMPLARNVIELAEADRSMHALAQSMMENKALVQQMVQLMYCDKDNVNDQCSLELLLKLQARPDRGADPKPNYEAPTPPTRSPSKLQSVCKINLHYKRWSSSHVKWELRSRSSLPWKAANRTRSRKMRL